MKSVPSKKELQRNMARVMRDWNLGPVVTSMSRIGNKPFWKKISEVWDITEKEGRRRNCGNCEYGNNTPEALKAMEKISDTKFDLDGGGRVWCEKFDFICHNLRVCQRWDKKYFNGGFQ